MKSIFYVSLFSMILFASSCGPTSTKGKWTDDDKKKFNDECTGVKEVKDLGELGTKLCDCMLKKSEQEFDSFRQADSDEEKMKTIATNCATEIMK